MIAPRIVAIAQQHLLVVVQFAQRRLIRIVTAFAVRHGQAKQRPYRHPAGKRRIGRLHSRRHHVTDKMERAIAHQRAGEQTCFAKNLKAVANADHQFARAASSTTARMIGEKRAIAPQRR